MLKNLENTGNEPAKAERIISGMTIATEDLTGQHGVLNGAKYVIIKAKYDGNDYSYLKWATDNLAVTESGRAKWNSTIFPILICLKGEITYFYRPPELLFSSSYWTILTVKMAVSSLIGNLYKEIKDPNLIAKISGHVENSRAFNRYRNIDEEMAKETIMKPE